MDSLLLSNAFQSWRHLLSKKLVTSCGGGGMARCATWLIVVGLMLVLSVPVRAQRGPHDADALNAQVIKLYDQGKFAPVGRKTYFVTVTCSPTQPLTLRLILGTTP